MGLTDRLRRILPSARVEDEGPAVAEEELGALRMPPDPAP
jgi:hypothetical protein